MAAAGRRPPRRDGWLWLGLPLLLALLALGALGWATSAAPGGALSAWADISLIWLLLPFFGVGLLVMAALGGMVYGVLKVIDWLPGPLRRGAHIAARVERVAGRVSARATHPFAIVDGFIAAVRAAAHRLVVGGRNE